MYLDDTIVFDRLEYEFIEVCMTFPIVDGDNLSFQGYIRAGTEESRLLPKEKQV